MFGFNRKKKPNQKSKMVKSLDEAKEVVGSNATKKSLVKEWKKSRPPRSKLKKFARDTLITTFLSLSIFGGMNSANANQANNSDSGAQIENTQGVSEDVDVNEFIHSVINDLTVIQEFIVAERFDDALAQISNTKNDINSLGKGAQRALSNAINALNDLESEVLEKQGVSDDFTHPFKVSDLESMSRSDLFNEQMRVHNLVNEAGNNLSQEKINYLAKVSLINPQISMFNIEDGGSRNVTANFGSINSTRHGNELRGTINIGGQSHDFVFQLN